MNPQINHFLKNFSFIMFANLYSLIISTIITFIVPRFFSEECYSYFQLENLYCGYIWLMSLGWNDGFYIKYGGKHRADLHSGAISSLILMCTVHAIIASIFVIIGASFVFSDVNKKYVFIMATISVGIELICNSLKNLLQAVNSMRQFGIITFIDRTIYSILVIILIASHYTNFRLLIGVDIISKMIMLGVCIFMCRDFIFQKLKIVRETFQQAKEIISIGISVSLASYASKLINSITQFAIEQKWGLLTFGKISLTLTISNAFTKFVSAVSLALFPPLRRTGEENRIGVYNALSVFLSFFMLALFCFYIPMKWALGLILPNYLESLNYMAILLPISLFETKVTMLVNTYLKLVRNEKEILFCNILSVVLSLFLALTGSILFQDMNIVLMSIVIVLAFRCYLEEYRLSKYIEIQRTSFDVLIMAFVFILSNWKIGGWIGTCCYIIVFLIYAFKNRDVILRSKDFIFSILKKPNTDLNRIK